MVKFVKPWDLAFRMMCSIMGLSAISTMGLGQSSVMGLSRVPLPPAMIMNSTSVIWVKVGLTRIPQFAVNHHGDQIDAVGHEGVLIEFEIWVSLLTTETGSQVHGSDHASGHRGSRAGCRPR